MKVQELIEILQDKNMMVLKPEQRQAKLAKNLNVKKYLSIEEKTDLVERIIDKCLFYEDGIYKIDGVIKYVTFTMMTIEAYTDLELSDDINVDYDEICKNGFLTDVISTFDAEYKEVLSFLQMKCEYTLASNCIEAKLSQFFDGILEKLDKLSTYADSLRDNINISQDDVNTLVELVSKLNK